MKALKKIISLTAMSCTLIATCLYAGAANPHVHEYHVTGKNLVSVRPGYTHEYISGIKTDPVTGIATAVYSTCTVRRYVYQGTYSCILKENGIVCGATLPEPYTDPAEENHSSCGK